MRYIPIIDAEPGMRLAYDLFDSFGRVLISSKTKLTDSYIEKLTKMGFVGLYIDDDLSKGIELEMLISPELRAEGLASVRERNIDRCKDISKEIVSEILSKGDLSLDLSDLRTYDDYTYAHSVNVAVLSSIIGFGLGMNEQDLNSLVLAGLLHDFGKMAIPSEILNKPGRLTPDEFQVMQSHATLSYDMIKERTDISAQVKKAVLFHHENVDGSGYPQGVYGDEISLHAKIIHVADVYDALISNRPYKKPYSPYEATEYLMGGGGTMFDKNIVEIFLKYVPLYPKGTQVLMSDGRKAIIYDNADHHNLRPILRLMDGTNIDLEDEKYLNITIQALRDDVEQVTEVSERERKKMILSNQRFHIVVFDHFKETREELHKTLSAQYDVVALKSITQTLIYLDRNQKPDLIIMDVNIPEKDGVNFAKKVIERTKHEVPIIVVTSLSDKDTVISCRMLGVASYILKPFQHVFLRSEIKRVLTGECDAE